MIVRVVIVLLLANLAWLIWTLGAGAAGDSAEPDRLQRQVQAQALQVQPLDPHAPPARRPVAPAPQPSASPGPADIVLVRQHAGAESPAASASPAGQAVADARHPVPVPEPALRPEQPASVAPPPPPSSPPPPAPTVCLQAGTFDERQAAALREAAAGLPEGSWRIESVQLPGRWMVYIGKLPDAIAVSARRGELRALGLDTDRPGSALEPGISLGRFSTEEAARRGLDLVARKGVSDARVVQERRDTPAYTLRLPRADAALQAQAQRQLRRALGGKELKSCS